MNDLNLLGIDTSGNIASVAVCNENTVDMLEDAIEQQTSYFSDYF